MAETSTKSTPEFKPFIAAETIIPEFTPRAIVLGALFGIIFGAATVYLALRAGLTVSASIPIAVLAIAVFRKLGRSTILENNIVQTIGSAGESVAAGVVFTVPALIFLSGGEHYFQYMQVFTLALVGGLLGVFFMVPLRRSLIVKEHGNLLYPEGTACADVLIAGEKGGSLAKKVFAGLWFAIGYKFLNEVLGLWKQQPILQSGGKSTYPNATLNSDITPEYLGVGYIIGPKNAGNLVSGGVLSWLVLIPLLSLFVSDDRVIADLKALSFTDAWIAGHSHADWFYRAYIRYIGAGAVAAAGIITLARSLPTIVSSFKDSLADLRGGSAGAASQVRTARDIPITWVVGGSLLLVVIMAVLPNMPGTFPGSLIMSVLIVVFGFFFVTVSSRIVGIIGSSSNPISGMTIATLMATCLIFVAIGWTGAEYQAVALLIGSTVCIAAANAGATSQDLKTGYLVGSTPIKQQIGLLIGVLASTAAIGVTLFIMDKSVPGEIHGIGSAKLSAPQATLMATIIKGLLAQQLPWGPVFVGVFATIVIELAGVHALSWAVGAYLPLSTTFPIFIGGLMRVLSEKISGKHEESEIGPGMLYSTGLVAGGSLAGIAIAILIGFGGDLGDTLNIGKNYFDKLGLGGDLIAAAAFGIMCLFLVRAATSKSELA
jgi:putative OPT family oligopeptide transporter